MRTRLLIVCLASMLTACGGGDDADDTTTVGNDTSDTGDEAPPDPGDGELDEPTDTEPEEEDDGTSCLPVSRCHSFANQDCAAVDAEGNIEGEAFSAGRVREACPGGRGMAETITECFNFIELSEGCGRSLPDLREPAWPCGRNEDGSCGVQM